MANLFSRATVTTIGLTCKAFLNIGFCGSITVNGLEILQNALQSPSRSEGRGIVTVANHLSTLDDPVVWGVLPWRSYLSERTTRWALGASDIMFTNPVFSLFFRNGQVIETIRGNGVYQPAVDVAIDKLNGSSWIHLFGEGKVNQPDTYAEEDGVAHLSRFKWGVGRILMETARPPVIIPMWLTGFDKLMPEGRPFPNRFLPRPGVDLSVTFGAPIPEHEITEALRDSSRTTVPALQPGNVAHGGGWMGQAVSGTPRQSERRWETDEEMARVRSEVTAIIRRDVQALGRRVSGDLLGKRK